MNMSNNARQRTQVLVAMTGENAEEKITRLNLQTSAIVACQCSEESVVTLCRTTGNILLVKTHTRGVGINRNIALLRSSGEFLLFADDDEILSNGYAEAIETAFDENPKADGIIFNINTIGAENRRRTNFRISRVKFYNYLNYGTVRLAVRRSSLQRFNVYFSTLFGGGALYGSGEDSLFIGNLIAKGAQILTNPFVVCSVDQSSSSWFEGYTDKYFYDKGAFFRASFGNFWQIIALLVYLKNKMKYNKMGNLYNQAIIKCAIKGAHGFDKLHPFEKGN